MNQQEQGRGRPKKPDALSGAERQALHRQKIARERQALDRIKKMVDGINADSMDNRTLAKAMIAIGAIQGEFDWLDNHRE